MQCVHGGEELQQKMARYGVRRDHSAEWRSPKRLDEEQHEREEREEREERDEQKHDHDYKPETDEKPTPRRSTRIQQQPEKLNLARVLLNPTLTFESDLDPTLTFESDFTIESDFTFESDFSIAE